MITAFKPIISEFESIILLDELINKPKFNKDTFL